MNNAGGVQPGDGRGDMVSRTLELVRDMRADMYGVHTFLRYVQFSARSRGHPGSAGFQPADGPGLVVAQDARASRNAAVPTGASCA